MKNLLICFVLIIPAAFMGCGTTAKKIHERANSEKTDVFTEVSNGSALSRGSSELIIRANIKTHIDGYYILESSESLHGKQGYPFVFNIDGQGIVWRVDGVRDVKPAYEADGKTSRDPEAREGLKYNLEKKVLLSAGTHKVFFGLPEEQYATEVEISLKAGETSILEFKPAYRTKRIPTRIPTFLKGIDRYEVFLNERQIV